MNAINRRSTLKNIHSSLPTVKLLTFLSTSTEICDKFVEKIREYFQTVRRLVIFGD
jgi:hypothetical protein